MKTIIENQNLFVKYNAMPKSVCDYIVNYSERENNKKVPEWQFRPCKFGDTVNLEIRTSDEVHIKDNLMCTFIWEFAKDIIPSHLQGRGVLGPDPNSFYLLRYKPGDKFECHRDGHSTYDGNKSFYTAMFYLSDVEEGGETVIYGEPCIGLGINSKYDNNGLYLCKPEIGKMVLMRHYILHKASPVTMGIKYVLRFNLLCEKFAPYYDTTSIMNNILKPNFLSNKYGFMRTNAILLPLNNQLLEKAEKCSNCNFVIDLNYDYYNCPGCNAPVVITDR